MWRESAAVSVRKKQVKGVCDVNTQRYVSKLHG